MKCSVFVYGTLRSPKVRKQVLGYDPASYPSTLRGFRIESIKLDGTTYPILIEEKESMTTIEGDVIEIPENELNRLDVYETTAYRRKKVFLEDDQSAWVYCR